VLEGDTPLRSPRRTKADQNILEPLDIYTLKPMLRQAFALIYTRASILGSSGVLLVPSLHIAAIMLFVMSQQTQVQQWRRHC
jgi:hypothetical protein